MESFTFDWLTHNPFLVALISILLNVAIAITGILPSAFITFGTVSILGFKLGIIILIIGEATGAVVSFILYRKGLDKLLTYPKINKINNRFLERLKQTSGIEAFFLVILLRILPFVPSGIVTITAAISKIAVIPFFIASTLGKIPALYIEAYSVVHILSFQTEVQVGLILFVLILFLIYYIWKRIL